LSSPWLETLERRVVLSSVSWINPNGGDWDTASNWSSDAIPTSAADVTISIAVSNPITHDASNADVVNSVTSDDPIVLSAGSLSIAAASTFSNTVTLSGGTLSGGPISFTGGATLVGTSGGGTLAGVTLDGTLDLATHYNANVTTTGGLTLNGTIDIGNASSSTTSSRINFVGAQTLGGSGTVIFGGDVNGPLNQIDTAVSNGDSGTLTIGSGITIEGKNGQVGNASLPLINQGTINDNVSGGTLNVYGTNWSSTGTLQASNGGTLASSGGALTSTGVIQADGTSTVSLNSTSVTINSPGVLIVQASATVNIAGSLFGNTTDVDLYEPQGTVNLDGSGTSTVPQFLEVMSQDLGNVAAGFNNNFAYGTLAVGSNDYVRLVDLASNSGSSSPEALYVNTLIVPSGSTLDLNGLHLYYRAGEIDGTITAGSATPLAGGGPLQLNTPDPGNLQFAGQVDDWTFFGRAGQPVDVFLHTGSGGTPSPIQPPLDEGEVTLLDPNGNQVAIASNSQSGADASILNQVLPADGTYQIEVQAATGDSSATGNYIVAAYDATVYTSTVQLNQTVYGQLNSPYSQDQWTFSAVANTQIQFNLLASASPSLQFSLTGPDGFTGFTGLSSSSGPVNLPISGSYTLTAYSVAGATRAYSFDLEQTSVTDLTLGIPYQGTLAGNGQAQLFVVTVTSPTVLGVALTDANTSDQNEVYISSGSVPTRDAYQYRFTTTGANQTLAVSAQPGTYDILVYNNLVATPGSSFTLLVQGSPFVVTGLTPGKVGNGQPADLLVTGVFPLAYQSPNAYQIQFVSAGGTIYPASPLYLSPTSLGIGPGGSENLNGTMTMAATLPPNTLPAGTYSVLVTDNLGNTQSLPNALTVTAGGTGVLKTSISVPNPIGWHEPSTLYVQYSNVGTAPMPAPLLVLTATQNGEQGAFLSLDPSDAGLGYVSNTTPAGFSQTVQFLASGAVPGLLEPGESITVPVYYGGWLTSQWNSSRPPIYFTVGELDATNTQTIDWGSLKAGMEPGTINQAAWNAIYPTLTAALGATWGQYLQTLDNDAVYLASIGEPTADLSKLLSFEVQKANAAYTAQTLASVTADSLPAPGMDLNFVQSFQQSISGRYSQGILGYGWTTNWDFSATTMSNGDAVIENDGISQYFSLQPNGSFAPEPGNEGTILTLNNGAYALTEPDGTIYQFNANGTLNYVQDTHGNTITAGYNGQNQLVSLTDTNGEYLDLTYNTQGTLATLTDSNGQTETYGYDPTGQFLTSYSDVYGTTKYTYITGQLAAQDNALASITYADGTGMDFSYDSQGRLISQSYKGGAEQETWTYLQPGGYITTDADGNQTTTYFNLYGANAESIDPLGNVTHYYYDSNLNLTKVLGPGGVSYTYTYDANGDLTSQTDPLGLTTAFTYDANNNLTSYTDAKGNTTSYAYDSANDLLSITYANGTEQKSSYNPLGEATQYINASGQAIGYTYNAQGLVATARFADGTSYSYTYNVQGNLTSATDAQANVTTFVYADASNPVLLTEVEYPDGTWLKFSYNLVGQRTQSVDQTGFTVNYAYDSLGRLSELTDGSGNLIVQYTYDAAGDLIQKDMGNGTRTVYTYDGDGDVLSITNYAPNHVTINSFDDYTYDPLGNVLTDTNQDGEWTYSYDADSQLIQAVFTPNSADPDLLAAQDLQYVYDAAGNRTSETDNGVTTTYVTNNVNEYTSSTTNGVTTDYQYDADGNLVAQITGSSTTTYTFNELNQLTAVNGPGLTASYGYDPLGNLVSQTVSGVTTKFQIDPIELGNVVGQYNGSGQVVAHYTYGMGLISQIDGAGNAHYYEFSAIGNTIELTNAAGAVVNSYVYDPFGGSLSKSESVANPFQFVGEYGVMDEGTGLEFMRARFYDADLGRFVAPDPLGILAGDTNYYRTTHNNPLTLIDPSGFDSCQDNPMGDSPWWRNLQWWENLIINFVTGLKEAPPGAGEAISLLQQTPNLYRTIGGMQNYNEQFNEAHKAAFGSDAPSGPSWIRNLGGLGACADGDGGFGRGGAANASSGANAGGDPAVDPLVAEAVLAAAVAADRPRPRPRLVKDAAEAEAEVQQPE